MFDYLFFILGDKNSGNVNISVKKCTFWLMMLTAVFASILYVRHSLIQSKLPVAPLKALISRILAKLYKK
jgi:hypothetical protein